MKKEENKTWKCEVSGFVSKEIPLNEDKAPAKKGKSTVNEEKSSTRFIKNAWDCIVGNLLLILLFFSPMLISLAIMIALNWSEFCNRVQEIIIRLTDIGSGSLFIGFSISLFALLCCLCLFAAFICTLFWMENQRIKPIWIIIFVVVCMLGIPAIAEVHKWMVLNNI